MTDAPPPHGPEKSQPPGVPSLLLILIPVILIVLLIGGTLPYLMNTSTMDSMGGPDGMGASDGRSSVGGHFRLVDAGGRPVTDGSWPGKFLLIYFGTTRSPSVCPTTLGSMAAALGQLGAAGGAVQPLFITIDPRHDTPAVVGAYTARFSPHLVGLTGSADAIAEAARDYRIDYAPHRDGPGEDDYSMQFSSVLYLMKPDGEMAAEIPVDPRPGRMAAEIASHLR